MAKAMTKTKTTTIAERMLKRMRKMREQDEDGAPMAECDMRDSKECVAIIWPHNGEDGTDEDSEECDGYWFDVFTDGSAIECCVDGSENVLTASEVKKIAGRWIDYKEMKCLLKK
jgi:hypothetical protein